MRSNGDFWRDLNISQTSCSSLHLYTLTGCDGFVFIIFGETSETKLITTGKWSEIKWRLSETCFSLFSLLRKTHRLLYCLKKCLNCAQIHLQSKLKDLKTNSPNFFPHQIEIKWSFLILYTLHSLFNFSLGIVWDTFETKLITTGKWSEIKCRYKYICLLESLRRDLNNVQTVLKFITNQNELMKHCINFNFRLKFRLYFSSRHLVYLVFIKHNIFTQ